MRFTILDCTTRASTLASVAYLFGVSEEELEDFIASTKLQKPEPHRAGEITWVAPGWELDQITNLAVQQFGSYRCPEITYWFHATRTHDPSVFSDRGLLPLQDALPTAWHFIETLAEGVVNQEHVLRAQAVSNQPSNMRLRAGSPQQQGPYGWLIGDVARNLPRAGKRDYTRRAPEAVEDIIELLDDRDGILMDKYLAATRPCIVKFYTTKDSGTCGCTVDEQIASALVYLNLTTKVEEPYLDICSAWTSACGRRVDGKQVEHVELL